MAQSLSHNQQLILDQALNTWQSWTCAQPLAHKPEVMERLDQGLSNYNWRLQSGEQQFVLRLDRLSPQKLGLSRSAEQRALDQAATAGLAPMRVWSNPELGVLISHYIQAQTPPDPGLEDIAGLLRQIHRLPPIKFRLKPMDRARRYLNALPSTVSLAVDFVGACQRLGAAPESEYRLCHNDLLRANRLWDGQRLLALDWEYAAMGHPLFDLAVICEGDNLDQTQCEMLIQAYCGDQAVPASVSDSLEDARIVYRELSRLWNLTTASD